MAFLFVINKEKSYIRTRLKKLFAILLLVLLVFNNIGYRYIINYFKQVAFSDLNTNIEKKNFSTDDLVEIKIPLNNPYISDHNYEDAYGETKVKGKYYQYVKKKISENTLYLMCLPNDKKEILNDTKNKLAENNITSNKNNSKNPIQHYTKILQAEFLEINRITFENVYALQQNAKSFSLFNNKLKPQFIQLKDLQPPENNI